MKVFYDENDSIISVLRYLEIIQKYFVYPNKSPGRWLCRGHSDFDYKLLPYVGRITNNPFEQHAFLVQREQNAFIEFYQKTYNELRENNKINVLAIAQHHGLKTRLLDWSLSPLIALFFAVEKEEKFDVDGALIALKADFPFNNIKEEITDPYDDRLDEYHFLLLPSLSPRLKVQNAVFQLFKNPAMEFKDTPNLYKFRIPAKNKKSIKLELYNLGISYDTIFPDWDGISKTINYNRLNKF